MTYAPHRAANLLKKGNLVLPGPISIVDEAPIAVALQRPLRQLPALRAECGKRHESALGPKEVQSGLEVAAVVVRKDRQLGVEREVRRAPPVAKHDNQRRYGRKRTHALGPVLAQPWQKAPHSSSPVLRDSCTVEAPGEGVTPLSALVGGVS